MTNIPVFSIFIFQPLPFPQLKSTKTVDLALCLQAQIVKRNKQTTPSLCLHTNLLILVM